MVVPCYYTRRDVANTEVACAQMSPNPSCFLFRPRKRNRTRLLVLRLQTDGYTLKFIERNAVEVENDSFPMLRANILGLDARCNSDFAPRLLSVCQYLPKKHSTEPKRNF